MKHLFLSGLLAFAAPLLFGQKPQLIPPMSHAAHVRAIAISPDGKHLLTCAGYLDNTVLLWDAAEGTILKIMEGHLSDILDAEYAPNGKHMLTLESNSGDLILWDNKGNNLLDILPGEPEFDIPDCIQNICFSHDGANFLAGNCSGELAFFNLKGKRVRSFPGGEASIMEVAVSKTGKYVASCDNKGVIRVYENNGTLLYELEGHGGKPAETIEFTPNERFLVSGGHDKLATVWDLSDGSLHSTLGPHNTLVRSIAISSDGEIIATAGPKEKVTRLWTLDGDLLDSITTYYANEILFFPGDTSFVIAPLEKGAIEYALNGEEIYTFTNESSPVTSVGFSPFSPDSLFIVTGGESRHLRVWDVANGDAMPVTVDPLSLPFQGTNNAPAAFYPDVSLLLAGHAGDSLYIYDLYTYDEYAFKKPASSSTAALAWGGAYFAISDYNGGVQLWTGDEDSEEGNLIMEWDKRIPSNYVSSLEFSGDGEYILTAMSRDWVPSVRIIIDNKTKQPRDGNGLPATLRRRDNFEVVRTYGTTCNQAVISPDGKYVATNEGKEHGLSLFDFETGEEKFHISLTEGARVICLAFSTDGRKIAVGGSDNLVTEYDLGGNLVQEYDAHYSAIRSVAYSPLGDYLITGSSDNTAKIWDTKTGKEIVSLMAVGEEDWLVITPEGLFDASPGAMEQLYFMVGLEVVPLEQLKTRYWDPHLLAKVMGFSKEERLKPPALTNVSLYPDIQATIEKYQLTINLTPQGACGVGKLSVYVNGKKKVDDINPGKKTSLSFDLTKYYEYYVGLDTCVIGLQATCDDWLSSPMLEIKYAPGATGRGQGNNNQNDPQNLNEEDPKLYAIIVGNSYTDTELKLNFPDADAQRFYDALQVAGKGLFNERVHLRLLTSSSTNPAQLATKANIKAAFEEFNKAKPNDVFIAFFSGHGKTIGTAEKSKFHYLAKGSTAWSELENPKMLAQNTVSSDEIIQWLTDNHAAKQALILDACNAATLGQQFGGKGMTSAQIRVTDEMKNMTGTFILAGAAGNKESFEAPKYGQGLLTYSLLDGMRVEGGGATDHKVDIMKLLNHACSKVPQLASSVNKTQVPEMFLPKNAKGGGFYIGRVEKPDDIKMSPGVPVIKRNNLFNRESGNDNLGLTKALKETLWEKTSSKLVHYDTDDYPDAYNITGPYTVEGDVIKVTVNLNQNGDLKKKLDKPVEGNKNDLQGLA
ncbi:MAG: caspase family protein, partial [Saprospiraceae bacterium]